VTEGQDNLVPQPAKRIAMRGEASSLRIGTSEGCGRGRFSLFRAQVSWPARSSISMAGVRAAYSDPRSGLRSDRYVRSRPASMRRRPASCTWRQF